VLNPDSSQRVIVPSRVRVLFYIWPCGASPMLHRSLIPLGGNSVGSLPAESESVEYTGDLAGMVSYVVRSPYDLCDSLRSP
jgi:hypothetical protein